MILQKVREGRETPDALPAATPPSSPQLSRLEIWRRRLQRSVQRGRLPGNILALLMLALWSIIVLLPLWVVFSIAVKSLPEFYTNPLGWPHAFLWSNFSDAWNTAGLGSALLNSLLVTTSALAILVCVGAMAAYPLARRVRKWQSALYIYFVAGLVVPSQIGVIALYRLMKDLTLIDTYQGVVLLYVATSLPFVIFLYTGFIQSIPLELEEAAKIDGASRWRTFWQIVFPLLRPVTATVIITSSFGIWNDFFTALLFLQDPAKQTLSLALFTFEGQYSSQWPLLFASITIAALPMIMLFLILQRYFVRGLTGGALKG
ncbi:MAG TPA: carbohydrate ABC transporter permease [Ktedonobacterales bacterium]|nr:carbohydrate ABC transporter permease [Ktedonobacterales bacterium]